MSVGLLKFEGDNNDRSSKIILSENIASEAIYNKYLRIAIDELNIKCFQDDAEIRKKDIQTVLKEIDMLIEWVLDNVQGNDLTYLLERLHNMKHIISEALNNEEDVLYIF